jgi:hypothetical protein
MSLHNLISKVLAAGLAAGIFLLWWPAHLPSTGVEWLVLRGLAWTLAFEILVLSFCPLENLATRSLTDRRAASQAERVRGLLAAAPAQAKTSGAVLLAFTGLLLPGLLLAHAGHLPTKPPPRPTQVVRKIVVRKVVKRTVVVHAPATVVQAPAQAPAAAAAPTPRATAPAQTASRAKTTKKPQTTAKDTKTAVTKAAPEKTATATPPAPATTTTALPDPAEAATPSASTATPTADAG